MGGSNFTVVGSIAATGGRIVEFGERADVAVDKSDVAGSVGVVDIGSGDVVGDTDDVAEDTDDVVDGSGVVTEGAQKRFEDGAGMSVSSSSLERVRSIISTGRSRLGKSMRLKCALPAENLLVSADKSESESSESESSMTMTFFWITFFMETAVIFDGDGLPIDHEPSGSIVTVSCSSGTDCNMCLKYLYESRCARTKLELSRIMYINVMMFVSYPSTTISSNDAIDLLHTGHVHVGVCSFIFKKISQSKHSI